MSRPPAHPKGWAPAPSVTSPPVSFRPATPTRHSPIHRLPPPYIPCPKPMRPTSSPLPAAVPQPYRYPSPCPSPQVYESPSSMQSYRPREFVVLEAPSPQQWSDEDNTTDGRSTAEIIAQQSQDYVDEKLAEYQATIYMLQAVGGEGLRDGSGDETFEEVLEERDVYTKDGRKKGKMVIVNMVTVHKSVKTISSPEANPIAKHSLSFDREGSMSRSSSRDSLSSPNTWRKSFVGTRSQFDLHIEEIKNEQERVQKKTFVNWINSYLSQRIPPLKIDDLIEDLKDGTKLLALLEVLSGERLAIERGRNMRRPHFLSNVNSAIQFLQSKRIKLVNINSADIVDGRPPIVLGLIWTIILYFQIEENTKGLSSLNYSFSGSTSSLESIRSPTMEINRKADGAKKKLLKWVGTVIPKESNIKVKDFGPSWRDGIAFLTIIDTIQTNLIDITTLRNETNRTRLETAFNVAEQDLGITRLLDPEDVDVDRPDERSVMTYVAQFVHKYPEVRSESGESIDKIQKDYNLLLTWLTEKTQYLSWSQNLSQDYLEFSTAQDEMVSMSHLYNRLKKICNSGSSISISAQSWKELEKLWTLLDNLMKNWQWQLDLYLPEPFKVIGEWITKAEQLINDNNIPYIMNEETAVIISRKLEDHKKFFADLPEVQQKFNELLVKTKNQNKEVNDLSRRLHNIEIDSHKRRTYLKFLEHKCCLIAFLNLTENKLKAWTVKYGRHQDVLQLLEKYNNFVIGNNIFQEFNKAFIDMQNVVQEYKHECRIEYKETVAIEKFMRQTAEQWKSIAMELRCAQSMLEEVISYWRRWKSLSEDMKAWLVDAVEKLNLPHEQRIDFFQDIGVWKEKYELLNDTVSFLIATCEDSICAELRQEFQSITATWESIFLKAKDYMHSGDMIRNRKEYLEGLDTLHKWNIRAEQIMSSIHLSSSQKIKDYLCDIQSLQSQLDQMDDLFKAISKKFQVLIKDLTRDEVNEMMVCIKREKESLVNIRASIPVHLNALHHMLVQYDALETGQQEINHWLNNCEEFLSTLKLSKSQKELHEDIEYLKSILVRMSYYQSMLSSKNKIFQSIIKSIQPEKDQGNNSEFVQTMADLNAKFSRITQECQQWDMKLQQILRCWHNFIEIEKVILDWIETSKQIFLEEQTSSRQNLESQKGYFEYSNNNKWITELENVEGELLRCILPSEQETIRNRSKEIKLKYQECLSMVPAYIKRVEFKINEITFNQCINEAEKELNIEQQMINRNENVNLILKRNIEYFDNGMIVKELKTCLNNMSVESKKISNPSIDSSLNRSIDRFESIEKRTSEIRQKCKQIPNQLQDYKSKFNNLEKWMNAVDLSVERLLKGLLNDEEFEKEKSIFQEICRDVDSKRDDMKWMVQVLDSLLPYVSEEHQQEEQKNLEELIVRYKHLIPTIDMTITKTEMYTKCFIYKKEVTEIGKILENAKDQKFLNKGESLDDLSELIKNQEQIIEGLEKQRMIVMSTLQRGKQLVKNSSSVPNFIPQLVSKLETDWSFVYNDSIDKFNKLKNAQRLLIDYTKTKNEVMEIIKKAENELRTVSDDNKHNSQEISMQLRSKQELSLALRDAAENMLNKLRDISQNLYIPEKEFAIENEISMIENKLTETIQTVDKETKRLEKLSMKLCELDSGLNKIHVWSVESAPAVIERIQQDQTNPEVKARGIEEVQDELQKQRSSLDRLTEDLHSFEKESDTNETQKLRQDLDEVRMSILNLECNTNRKNEEINIDLNEWQVHKAKLDEIRPWLENVEKKINTDQIKPITLQMANDWLQNTQLINLECQEKIENLKTITSENKTPVILNEVDAIQSRCISVQSSAVQETTRLQRLLFNWNELNEKAQKIEDKLNQPLLFELKELNLNRSISEDLLEKKLMEHKALTQELNECLSDISSLSQTLNGLNQNFSLETTSDIKEKLSTLKAKNNEYLKLMHEQMQTISNIISDKKEHKIKVNAFCEWLTELDSKVNKCNVVPSTSIEEMLKKLHTFNEEHLEKQSLFTEIEEDFKHFDDNDSVQQSIMQFKELQDLLQKKKILLEKANEFFIWNETLLGKLKHVEFQFDTNQDKINLISDISACSEEVDLWKNNINSIEQLLQQSKTTIPGLSFADQFEQLQLKLEQIQEKLKSKEENDQKVKDCQKMVSELNDDLVEQIKIVDSKVNEHILTLKSWNDIALVIPKLQTLKDTSELFEQLKTLEKEGEILTQLDKNNSIFVQNILFAVNSELNNLKTKTEQSIENLTELNDNWLNMNNVKDKIKITKEECKTILESIETPNDLTEAQVIEDKYNRALKQSTALLDVLPVIEESVQKMVTLGENYPQLNAKKCYQIYKKDIESLEKHHADLKEKAEIAHSQQVIWKQVNQTKDSILQWLSDVNIELLDCTNNLDDIEKIKNKLVKYSEEKNINLDLKNNLNEKINKLQKLNGNKPIITLDSLSVLINDQFDGVESIACNLVRLITTFSQREEAIRAEIKKRTFEINQIRENVNKCDNLNNELDTLLINLKSCQKCKNELIKMNLNIDTVNHSVSEMTESFPIIAESTAIKELKSLKKRYESVVQQVDKVETTLMTYLKKHLEDDLNNLLHSIKSIDEKLTWCKPEEEIEKEQIEVKLDSVEGIKGNLSVIKEQKSKIDHVLEYLNQYSSSDINLEELSNNDELLSVNLENTEKQLNEVNEALEKMINLWVEYQKHLDNILPLVNVLENDIKMSVEIPIDMNSINVIEENVNKFQFNVDTAKQFLNELESCVKNIKCIDSKSTLDNQTIKIERKLESYQNNISKCLEKIEHLKEMKIEFNVSFEKANKLRKELNNKLKSIETTQSAGKKSIQNAQSNLGIMKNLGKQLEESQQLVNGTVSKGECMYPDITMENRDEIRSKIKQLRLACENLNDECGNITKTIENILVQKSSFDESCKQIQNWLYETEEKFNDCKKLKRNNIIDKKTNCHNLKTLKQDLITYKDNINQLNEKVTQLNEPDTDLKLKDFLKKYDSIALGVNKCLKLNETHLKNHESYLESVEIFKNYLKVLQDEYSVTVNNVSETDSGVFMNIISHKSEGELLLEKCREIGSTVLKETDVDGKTAIQNELDEIKINWECLMLNCENTSKMLSQKQNQNDKMLTKIENLDKYLRLIETQIKDRSLKNSLASKQQYLEKLKQFDEDIIKKHKEILEIQSETIEVSPNLNSAITNLIKTYQNVKTRTKESILRYENFVREHQHFDSSYEEFIELVKCLTGELNNYSEVVGDLGLLQARQKKLLTLSDSKCQQSVQYESLVNMAEKLYAQTSPDGREVIRQNMKDLRNSWESVSETLQSSLNKLDNCLLQFAEFSLSQEQLTKWLKNIEHAMQQHTETKATLQEKKAQLQNHIVINQEILSHQNLVQSVCDKAQELVNQTKDNTLNTYLESIKNLYEKIVTKSKELMNSLELSVQNHSEFNQVCQKLKLILKEQCDKIRENDSIAAEKDNIIKKINIFKEIKTANTTENELRNHLEEIFQLVSKTTTKKGINVMLKEISKIDSDKSQLIIHLDTIIEKMEEILIQWNDFESEFEEITNWFRLTESLIKDQQLQSTFENKENKLKLFVDKRNEVLNYEPKIEKFIDNSNNLLHASGVERLKPLILQVGNRYQLILVLSKEIVAKWQNITDDHKNFNNKFVEFNSWLETLESKPAQILDDDDLDLNKKLSQLLNIYGSSDQTSAKISLLTSLGESLYPDTSAAGRETIRQQLKDIRDRWDTLDEKVKTAQKTLGVQSQQWNSYQETLLQTINWLESIEKVIASNQSPIWSSPQEIRSKLLKQKATMQEINSHSRMIETIMEKGKTIKKPKNESDSDISLKERYDLLREKMNNSISQLENYLETYQQYQDLYKSYQDTQKQLWDQLSMYTDYSGNKQILESRLNKVNVIQTTFNNNKTTLLTMERFVENSKDTIPQKAIDTMLRDHTNLLFEQEKFQSLLNDLFEGLQSRINQWVEFENLMQQLISWHNDTEKKLQNYSEKGTLEEKTQQYNKFQDLEKEIKGKSNLVRDLIAFGDLLQQSLMDDMKKKVLDIDKLDQSNEYESTGEIRLSTKVQQISSRYQSMQTTIKDILNKCNESIKIHQEYVDKYNECSIQLSNVQSQFKNLNKHPLSSQTHQYLIQKNGKLNELSDTKPNVTCLLNSCMELGEKLYLSTSTSGRENIKGQLDELQNVFDTLYDDLLNTNREVKDQLTRWGGFEELYNELNQWFNNTKQLLNKNLVLKSTLDEKKMQLQIYRDMLQATLKRKQDIVKLQDFIDNMQMQENNDILVSSMSKQHDDILKQIQDFVDKYEAIVKDHEQYTKSVMEMQEWLDATHNTLMLWGDTNLEKISLLSNLDRIKNLLLSLTEEENRIYNIQKLAEKVIPGTIENGQVNIRAQIDSSQQDWEGLMTTVKTSIEALENKINSWNEFDVLKESCLTWLRETDYKIHAIDLKNSLQEKKIQLEELKDLQGVIRAKEFEIDSITEKSQNLYTMSMSTKNSQITEIVQKFHQLSMKIKELVGKWQLFVNNHLEFESSLSEAVIWLDTVDDKLTSCTDFKSTSKADLEEKLIVIQDILLYKDDGFNKVQNCIEVAQIVLANTAPEGHKSINESLTSLQEHWSSLATKMVETKTNIDESIQRWSGFLEHVKQVGKIIDKFEDALPELEEFQGTMSEKRDQLEKLKHLDEKVRCEKLEMDSLKLKAQEMLKTGHQSNAVAETQEVFNKFDQISDKVKKLLNQREQQYKDHKTYKEAYEELSNFLNRSRDKIPSLKERPLSDKLAIENAITPLETLLNKRAQGELLLDNLNTIGDIIIASTSENGEKIIKQEISSIADELNKLFDDILTQKDNLHAIHTHWREYKDEYEKLSDWLQQIDISMKAIKNTPLATVLEKTDQVKQIQDVLDNLEKGKSNIERFNESSGPLLKSHLETYVNNQLRHLNSRYEVQVNLAKDVQRKVETNLEHHVQYENYLEKAKTWMNGAKEAIRCGNETTTVNTSKEVLQSRLDNILELLKSQEEGQLIIHSTVNSGEKVLRSTRSDGKDLINKQLKEIQVDWDRLVKKIATSKVHIETSLLQWADYNSSYSHLEQWISDREAKLDEVCELKVTKTKKTLPGIGSLSIGERKATLRRTNSIVQDIVSFEPMIQKVTLKAEDLQQAVPANEITNKYHTLSIKAKDLYERQKETVRLHQEFIDAGNDFAAWLRSAKERISKISEPTGDKEMLSAKSVQFKVLQSELPTGQSKLEVALERAEKACSFADEEEKEIIEQEVVMLQEEFDIHNDTLQKTKALLEDGIYKWNDFDDYSKGATEWLNNTEQLVQSYNKLQPSLEGKKEALEEFQTHLQTLFDWQKELDILNGKAQVLLETCSDTRLSNSITQMTTKYNTLLSLAKEVMRRLELHYQEHQQHNSLYQECLDWLERTRDKLNECEEIPNSLNEVKSKLQSLKVIRQTLEQGQNRLRYIMELKEKVVLSTEPQGTVKIEEDTENLRHEFDKLSNKIQVCNNNMTLKVSQLEELEKCIKILNECLDDISSKINGNNLDQPLNDLSEKKSAFEKLKSLLHELNTHNDLVNRLSSNIDDKSSSTQESINCVSRYNSLINMITNKLSTLENQVAEHETYRSALINLNDWLRKTRVTVQSCADTHGDNKVNASKIAQLKHIEESSQSGEVMVKDVLALIETLKNSTGPEGCDKLNQDKNQLNSDWDKLKHFIKEVQLALNKCAKAWDDFNIVHKALKDWETDLIDKVNTASLSNEAYTPDDLDQYKLWLQEIINQNVSIEELTDRCESLMELSACNWVRDDTLKIQSSYTTLLTSTQGLVSKAEKSLTDHTEFIAAKEKVEEWLNRAHGTVQDCIGEGDLDWVKDKLQTVNLVSSRITEGQYLMNGIQDVFTKALNNTLAAERNALVNSMEELSNSWNSLNIDLNSVIAHLKSLQARWEENNEAKDNLEKWLSLLESKTTKKHDFKADVGEMKTLLERLNNTINEIDEKETDFNHVITETEELSKFCKNNNLNSDIKQLKTRKNILKEKTLKRIDSLESEISQHSNYLQALQESEKWLLQISFQLMAHNSLYITNRQQTQEQIRHHQVLLNEIIQYQDVLDDLKSKGNTQIQRYVSSTPSIQTIVEQQLNNIQDSYNSLFNTAQQIKARLEESLLKFKQYEDMLESIWSNLDDYQPLMNKTIDDNWTLTESKEQLTIYRDLLNKLQGEKTRLALAVQACEAAVASISRPSSPVESNNSMIPEKEISIRLRLEENLDQNIKPASKPSKTLLSMLEQLEDTGIPKLLIPFTDYVQNFVDELINMISVLENKQNQREIIYEWIEEEIVILNKMKEKPTRINIDATAQEITNLNEILQNVNDKKLEIAELVSDDPSDKLVTDLDNLTDMINEILLKKQSDQNILLAFKNSETDLQKWFDNLSKCIESLEKGSGNTCQQKLELFNDAKEDYINNGEKLINNLRLNCQNLREVVSISDAQLLDDQMKSADRRYRDFWTRMERKYEILENSKKNLLYARSKIEEINSWIDEKLQLLNENNVVSYDSNSIEKKLIEFKNINKEAETKHIFLTDSLTVKLNALELESEPFEFNDLEEKLYKPTINKLSNFRTKINENLLKTKNMHEASQKFENSLNQCNVWLDRTEKDLSPDKYKLEPLELIVAEKNIEKILNLKTDIQCFKNEKLSDLEKNSQVLSTFCDKGNTSVIQSVLNDVLNKTEQIDKMSDFAEEKSKAVLENRKNVENNINLCQQWFSEVEVIMSADVRLSSLNIVEDQLQKYDDLNNRSSEIDNTIEKLKINSEKMVLCEPDTLKISDQILSLENSQKRTKSMIKDRIEMIGEYLEKMKNISKIVEESKEMIHKVQSNLQELNRPVGSTVDDVKDMIKSYEALLKELKEWNDKLSDNDNGSLNEIVKQQEELINTIEKQLSKLRQLLHLHEQFMTLIADIVMFLTKYSSVVNEIGKSGNTIQNKIKQFDEVTIKIQECEATLLLATDKGERIAEVGSAFDHNNITQQLQSLKQQLLTLRKAVEKERQKLEATAAEHIKLAADLEQVLDWIRENEALIKSRPLLEINIKSVETDLKAHEELKVKVDDHLSRLKTIQSIAQNENIEDSTMLECLSEASSFLNTIPKELQDRQTYLNINKDYRVDYEQLKDKFIMWINEAKQKLKSVEEDKIDYANMVSNIEHLKAFFGDQTVHDLVTKKIKHSIDKIRPSLTSQQNDVLTAKQQGFIKDLDDVMNSAKAIQKKMDDEFGVFKEYRNVFDKVSSILERCKYNEDPIQNLAGLYFNVEKITLVQNDLLRQQNELDSLLNKSKLIVGNNEIQSNADSLAKQWSDVEKEMSSRIMLVTDVGDKWKNIEDEYRKIETEFTRIKDALTSVDLVIRSKDTLVESLVTLRKLKENLDVCGEQLNSTRPIGESVLNFLTSESHPASSILKDDIKSLDEKYDSIAHQLNSEISQFEGNFNDFTEVEARLDKLESSLNNLKPEVEYFYVFAQNTEQTQKELDDLSEKVKEAAGDLKQFIECTQNNYISLQKTVPNDLLNKFNPLELVSEELTSLMDSNSRGLKRAKTVRTEYLKYVDDVQRWLQEAEVKVQDRGSEPKKIKEHIQAIEDEISAINDKLNKAIKHGKEIIEKTKDEEEKEMIPKTIESLVGKMSQVKLWLDEKRNQIGDTLDAWQKFLSVYDLVMAWCQSKTNYLEEPITLSSLEVVKQKAHEFSAAVKSSKQQSKHLAEMSKELDIIALSTDVGQLPEKLEEANNAKNDVEGKLSEKNALLHETCEEWEQFERKLKDVKSFIEKSQNAIESTANKKRTLREQHDLREKMLADITIQRNKITLSTEKLQIHFRAGFGGSENIQRLSKDSLSQLDKLFKIVEEQAHNLEESLSQLDKYQQEIQHLRQKVITAEQQLRLTQSPTYLPHDRQKAVQEQNAFQEQIRVLQSKINSRTERIKLIIQRGSPISDPLLN